MVKYYSKSSYYHSNEYRMIHCEEPQNEIPVASSTICLSSWMWDSSPDSKNACAPSIQSSSKFELIPENSSYLSASLKKESMSTAWVSAKLVRCCPFEAQAEVYASWTLAAGLSVSFDFAAKQVEPRRATSTIIAVFFIEIE